MPADSLRVLRLAIAALLVMPMAACVLDDVNFDQADTFSCTTDDDCLANFECKDGFCQQKGISIGDCVDNDQDGFRTGPDCPANTELDCDDGNNQRFPGNTEKCDGIDNNCDENEEVDEGIAPRACPLNKGVCETAGATQSCENGELTACDYGPDFVEDENNAHCSDQLDNDCDGTVNEGCPTCTAGDPCNVPGGLGHCNGLPASQCACKEGTQTCTEQGAPEQCVDSGGTPVVFPFSTTEISGNNIDDDCDGTVD